MPQSQRPSDLGVVLDRLADRCDAAVESLLLTVPVAGDRETQLALEGYLDQLMDTLRMLAATGRETRARLVVTALDQRVWPAGPVRLNGRQGSPGRSR
jgi:hypothetical protein